MPETEKPPVTEQEPKPPVTEGDDKNQQPDFQIPKSKEEFEKLVQSISDARVTQALNTQGKKFEERLKKEREEAAKLAAMGEEEKSKVLLEQKEQEIAERERAVKEAERKSLVSDILVAEGLDAKAKALLSGDDEKAIKLQAGLIKELLESARKEERAKVFKEVGINELNLDNKGGDVMAEFTALLNKPTHTGAEQKKLNELAIKVKELKK